MGRNLIDSDPDGLRLKPNGYWYYPVLDPVRGKHEWRSTKQKDRTLAREARQKLETAAAWRTVEDADMTIGIARQHYTERHKVNAPATIERLWVLAKARVADCRIADPKTRQTIHALRDKLLETMAPRSVRNVLNHLVAIMNFVAKTSRADDDDTPIYSGPRPKLILPSDKMHPVRRRKASTLHLTLEQVQRLTLHVRHQSTLAGRISIDQRIIFLIYKAGGQRATRIGLLPWKNINRKLGTIDFANIPGIPHSDNKTGKADVVIPPDLDRFLERCEAERLPGVSGGYFLDGAMTRGAIYARLRRLYRNVLGIDFGGPHALRKALATHIADAGEQHNVGYILGIDDDTARKFYIGKNTGTARRVMAVLPELDGGVDDNVVPLKKG